MHHLYDGSYWELKKEMAAGSEPPHMQLLMAKCDRSAWASPCVVPVREVMRWLSYTKKLLLLNSART